MKQASRRFSKRCAPSSLNVMAHGATASAPFARTVMRSPPPSSSISRSTARDGASANASSSPLRSSLRAQRDGQPATRPRSASKSFWDFRERAIAVPTTTAAVRSGFCGSSRVSRSSSDRRGVVPAAPKTRVSVDGRAVRTVAIWKVHGSLDWFQDSAQQIFGVRSALKIHAALTPLMITPGIEKYRLTHGEPFTTVLACANAAVEKARAYFCVGYGFNDEHLQAKLQARCDWDSVPLFLIAKELPRPARTILKSGQCRRYLAIEDGPAGARAYMHDVPDGFDLDKPLWQLHPFLDHMTGARA